jgi:hypothetical protein
MSPNCAGVTWTTFVVEVIATRAGPSFTIISTVLPASDSTLPLVETFSGAGGAADSEAGDGDSEGDPVDSDVVEEPHPTSSTAPTDKAASKAARVGLGELLG